MQVFFSPFCKTHFNRRLFLPFMFGEVSLVGLRHALGLQLCQFVGNKVPLEGRVLAAASTQRYVLGESVVSAAPSFVGLPLAVLPIVLFLPSTSLCPHHLLLCCPLVSCSCSSFGLFLGGPVGCKAIPESWASGGLRGFFWFRCERTENKNKK